MNSFFCYDWEKYRLDDDDVKPLKFSFSNKICNGNGKCIKQIYFNTFTKDINMICLHNCEKIKCKNHILCNNSQPQWICEINDGLCDECNINYGKWKNGQIPTITNAYCPICMEEKDSIKLKNCNHTICIDCYKKCNEPIQLEPPKFPYDEITYKSYIVNPFHARWYHDALIYKYERQLKRWNRNCLKYPDKNLTLCCMCRK